MPVDIPTDPIVSVAVTDPKTGLPSQDALQRLQAILRVLRDHEARIAALE